MKKKLRKIQMATLSEASLTRHMRKGEVKMEDLLKSLVEKGKPRHKPFGEFMREKFHG